MRHTYRLPKRRIGRYDMTGRGPTPVTTLGGVSITDDTPDGPYYYYPHTHFTVCFDCLSVLWQHIPSTHTNCEHIYYNSP